MQPPKYKTRGDKRIKEINLQNSKIKKNRKRSLRIVLSMVKVLAALRRNTTKYGLSHFYIWDRTQLQACAAFSLSDFHFDTYIRPTLILQLMSLCFAAVYRAAE